MRRERGYCAGRRPVFGVFPHRENLAHRRGRRDGAGAVFMRDFRVADEAGKGGGRKVPPANTLKAFPHKEFGVWPA